MVEYIWLEGVREEYEQVREVRGGGHTYLDRTYMGGALRGIFE